jgi:plastocyanin
VLDSGESYSFTFVTPGTYPYFCSIHPHMTGKVVVTQ